MLKLRDQQTNGHTVNIMTYDQTMVTSRLEQPS